MKDIRLSDDVAKPERGDELGNVADRMIGGPHIGMLKVTWLESGDSTMENPDDLEIITYGPQWTVKDAKADAKLRGLKIRTGSPYKTIIR